MKQTLPPELAAAKTPRLLYVSKIDTKLTDLPRVMHHHEGWIELILILKGHGQYSIDGRQIKVCTGDLVVYNSDIIHDEILPPESQLAWVCVAIAQVQQPGLRANALIPDTIRPVFPTGDLFDSIRTTCDLMFDQLTHERPGAVVTTYHLTQALLTLARQVIDRVGATTDGSTHDEPLAQRVIHHLDRHYAEPIGLHDLAATFHVSAYYLAHVFKDSYGYSPMQYMLRRRIGEAQSLLISTKLSVTEIATHVGYDHPSHFNRQFSKYVGMPPRQYRIDYLKTTAGKKD
ncbi:MAG: AraC family transcriptional regulator [Eubacteriales bacterium]|nr:AraC family transcriptional regulator [Eubacteriales bacterium]